MKRRRKSCRLMTNTLRATDPSAEAEATAEAETVVVIVVTDAEDAEVVAAEATTVVNLRTKKVLSLRPVRSPSPVAEALTEVTEVTEALTVANVAKDAETTSVVSAETVEVDAALNAATEAVNVAASAADNVVASRRAPLRSRKLLPSTRRRSNGTSSQTNSEQTVNPSTSNQR